MKQVATAKAALEKSLLAPWQPLHDNLEPIEYEGMMADPVKYELYEQAVYFACDRRFRNKSITVMVVGAGFGGLVLRSMAAARRAKADFNTTVDSLIVVEKNPVALKRLKKLAKTVWSQEPFPVRVVSADMRYLSPQDYSADVIVSELLGSFGDNELSPECLKPAEALLKPGGLFIPESYTSYLAPISAPELQQACLSVPRAIESWWVLQDPFLEPDGVTVCSRHLRSTLPLAPDCADDPPVGRRLGSGGQDMLQKVFTFTHPSNLSEKLKTLTTQLTEESNAAGAAPTADADGSTSASSPSSLKPPMNAFGRVTRRTAVHAAAQPVGTSSAISATVSFGSKPENVAGVAVDNKRRKRSESDAEKDTSQPQADGLLGFMSVVLFEDIGISTRPYDHTPKLDEWFPAYFPLSRPCTLPFTVEMRRRNNGHAVWYEWDVTDNAGTSQHNIEGSACTMALY